VTKMSTPARFFAFMGGGPIPDPTEHFPGFSSTKHGRRIPLSSRHASIDIENGFTIRSPRKKQPRRHETPFARTGHHAGQGTAATGGDVADPFGTFGACVAPHVYGGEGIPDQHSRSFRPTVTAAGVRTEKTRQQTSCWIVCGSGPYHQAVASGAYGTLLPG